MWTEEVWASPLDKQRRIYCNRTMNMQSIRAIGFDMDYTLAQYKPETFETLAHTSTVDKLVKVFGYPKKLYDLPFDWRYMTRGLVIDKKRGNMLKIDRHKYVKIASHGFGALSRDERMSTYNTTHVRHEFDEPDFALIDTLFSLAEAHLFMQLVELLDAEPKIMPPNKSYADLYRDVRGAVDLCHRDGSIKREVTREPEKYIHADPGLVPLLEMLRQSGKKLFIATNSLWDYTNVVMNWLISGKKGSRRDEEWLKYFDVVITGCGKPRFFTERKDLFEVDPATSMLWNTEGGSPMIPLGEADLPEPMLGSTAPEHVDRSSSSDGRSRVFQGGSYIDLHKMLDVRSGSEVLYIGDHIYGDVLRSKKDLGWRTMLVVPELESELDTAQLAGANLQELRVLRHQRDSLDDQIQRLEWRIAYSAVEEEMNNNSRADQQQNGVGNPEKSSNDIPAAAALSSSDEEAYTLADLLHNLREQRDGLKLRHRQLLQRYHEAFHPVWGQLLKTGYQNSRYAHQIERFACLYTSHVSNMLFYSPLKSYKARLEIMAHEEDSPGVMAVEYEDSTGGDEGLVVE